MNSSFSNQPTSFLNWVYRIILLISLILSLVLGYSLSNYLKISKITSPHKIETSLVNDLKTKNLFLLNENEIKLAILKTSPLIDSVTLEKRYPNEIYIDYTLTKPHAQIVSKNNFYIVDSHGKVLSKREEADSTLKLIYYYQQLRSFESKKGAYLSDPDILYALSLYQKAKNSSLSIVNLKIEKPKVILMSEKDQQIYLSTKKQIDKNLKIVQNINKTFMIKGNKPKIINLLFEKAIITL